MMTNRALAGVVLAGGFSTRFGDAEKATAPLDGWPMIRHVVERLGRVTDGVVVNCREEQLDELRAALSECSDVVGFAIDPIPDRGPIAGIYTGLSAVDGTAGLFEPDESGNESRDPNGDTSSPDLGGDNTQLDAKYTAVVACDMPFVDPALFELLVERAQGHDGAVVQLNDGWYQTTQAVYHTERMARACENAIDADDNRILTALDALDWVVVEQEELEAAEIPLDTFESVDTREELRKADRRL